MECPIITGNQVNCGIVQSRFCQVFFSLGPRTGTVNAQPNVGGKANGGLGVRRFGCRVFRVKLLRLGLPVDGKELLLCGGSLRAA